MKVTAHFPIRDLYDETLRNALKPVRLMNVLEGDIVAAARPILYIPDENIFDHRYSGEFYQTKSGSLWPISISTMRPIWQESALEIGEAIRNCQKLKSRTGVSVLLARDQGLKTKEVRLFCTSAGVVWRVEEPTWNTSLQSDDEIEGAVQLLYGGYLDEVSYGDDPSLSAWELGSLMSQLISLDAYEIASNAASVDAEELLLARKMSSIDMEVEPWFPSLL